MKIARSWDLEKFNCRFLACNFCGCGKKKKFLSGLFKEGISDNTRDSCEENL